MFTFKQRITILVTYFVIKKYYSLVLETFINIIYYIFYTQIINDILNNHVLGYN